MVKIINEGISSMYQRIKKQANEIVITEGTLQPYIYIVISGTLNAIQTRGRKIQVLAKLNAGDFVGEMAHLGTSKLHSASIVAEVESELVQIDADKIYDVLAQNPTWLKALLKNLVKKIETANTNKTVK